jgi:hypothetical protein
MSTCVGVGASRKEGRTQANAEPKSLGEIQFDPGTPW